MIFVRRYFIVCIVCFFGSVLLFSMNDINQDPEQKSSGGLKMLSSLGQEEVSFMNLAAAMAKVQPFYRFGYAEMPEKDVSISDLKPQLLEYCETLLLKNKFPTRLECQRSIDVFLDSLSMFDRCYKDLSGQNVDSIRCVKEIFELIPIPENKTAILWTGKRAKNDALSVEGSAILGAKYSSLEATLWGEFLDYLDALKLVWRNQSLHWEFLFRALAYKSQESSKENPVVVFISIPIFGAFAQKEFFLYINSHKQEYISIYWYGDDICEQEKVDRIINFCNNLDDISKGKCIEEVKSVDCSMTCVDYVKRALTFHDAKHEVYSENEVRTDKGLSITCRPQDFSSSQRRYSFKRQRKYADAP